MRDLKIAQVGHFESPVEHRVGKKRMEIKFYHTFLSVSIYVASLLISAGTRRYSALLSVIVARLHELNH